MKKSVAQSKALVVVDNEKAYENRQKYVSEVSNKHGVFLILFEKIFPTTCLIRASTFINF